MGDGGTVRYGVSADPDESRHLLLTQDDLDGLCEDVRLKTTRQKRILHRPV